MNALTLTPIGGEPRIFDLTLAERLGFEQPRDIRKLVKRNLTKLQRFGLCATVARCIEIGNGAKREVKEFYLNQKQAVWVCMKCETDHAFDMQLARNWKALESQNGNAVADLNFRQAIKLLSAPKPAKPAQKRLPKTPAKCATPVAVLPKPEPERQPAKAPVAKLDLSFPPPPPKAKLTPLQEYLAAGDAARRAAGLPVAEPIREPDPESLGFIGITAMQRLDGQFNETLDRVFPKPEHVYFQTILRPIEELRDFIPKDVRTIEQAQATVDLLEIITQQARLRLAWLEIHPEPERSTTLRNLGDLVL